MKHSLRDWCGDDAGMMRECVFLPQTRHRDPAANFYSLHPRAMQVMWSRYCDTQAILVDYRTTGRGLEPSLDVIMAAEMAEVRVTFFNV
jgi:hypothetical protein